MTAPVVMAPSGTLISHCLELKRYTKPEVNLSIKIQDVLCYLPGNRSKQKVPNFVEDFFVSS